jgi:hypothetical protein
MRAQPEPKRNFGAWIKENGAVLLVALIGVGAAFLGAYYGATSQADLWRKEKAYQFQIDVLNKRIEIIRAIVKADSSAQRVSILMSAIKKYSSVVDALAEQCKAGTCPQLPKEPFDLIAANKEISDLQADRIVNLQLAAIYFCEKTRSALINGQKETRNWWEVDEATMNSIVAPMINELTCGMDFEGFIK